MPTEVVIVGGGTAGWMAAAALSSVAATRLRIRVVESDEIATIGVGEATIPSIRGFNRFLNVDENDFLRQTQGTFKLGIEFVNWHRLGASYIHGFGLSEPYVGPVARHHLWIRRNLEGCPTDLAEYSVNVMACRHGKFSNARPEMVGSPMAEITSAYHFDAGLYARYLRRRAEAAGVARIEGTVVEVGKRDDGGIAALQLRSGERVAGDLFLDCSGVRALLLAGALGEPFDDWSEWLPCDRAIAVPCASVLPLLPYTRATARHAGWQWRIPLQNRIGNGHVYSSRFLSADEATSQLMANLDGEALAEPRYISFTPGRRRRTWVKNCVAIGLSSGFFEPIESTNIHLIQTAIQRLLLMLPGREVSTALVDEYNRQTQFEYERIRDFIVLHYKATERDDTAFWRHCQRIDVPATLQHRIDLFRTSGQVIRDGNELFGEGNWLQVLVGQGVAASDYHPLADAIPSEELATRLDDVRAVIRRCVDRMPSHGQYIAEHCSAAEHP